MDRIPLLGHRDPAQIVAYRDGRPVSRRRFLADVARTAARLPAGGHLLNACTDRYAFAVGLAAAIVARTVSLLPANLAPETLRQLRQFRPDLVCLVDGDELPGVHCLRHADAPPGDAEDLPGGVPEIAGDQPVAWLFTSGSTGEPVPHLRTWGSLWRNTGIEAQRLGLDGNQTIVATVPAQHSYGFESSLLVALRSGSAFSAARPFYPDDIRRALEAVPAPRILVSTPFHLHLLAESGTQLPAVALLLSATAPLALELAQRLEAMTGAPLLEIYGSTDSGQIASRRTTASAEWQLFDDVRLRPGVDGTWVEGGHVGAAVLLHDVLEVVGHDHFLLHGRTADLVNIAGKRSSLGYLNHQLASIPGVCDGVFVIPDEASTGSGITRLAAVVVAPGLDAEAIRRSLRERIDPVFLPRPLVVVAALPRNATGKLPRSELLALLADRGGAARTAR